MRRDLVQLRNALVELGTRASERKPAISHAARTNDAEAVELFAKARAGDADAQNRVIALIRERKWTNWLGDLGRQAARQLIWHAAGGDPVWEAGNTEKANALRAELLGEKSERTSARAERERMEDLDAPLKELNALADELVRAVLSRPGSASTSAARGGKSVAETAKALPPAEPEVPKTTAEIRTLLRR